MPERYARKLTGHKVNQVNENISIGASCELTAGGAPSSYVIEIKPYPKCGEPLTVLRFHEGDPNEVGTQGITHEALLEIMIDRLHGFQGGPFACKENELAMRHLIEARTMLNSRTKARQTRGVEGKPVP